MYDFIRKAEYFDWWDRGLADKTIRSLKNIQDAWVLSELVDARGLRICEVGGGHSRVLRQLAKNNACINADKLEGAANGPKSAAQIPGVETIPAYLGDFDPRLPDASFDALFSISVLEHIPDDRLADTFADMARILRPGGVMLHAIDLYIFDEPRPMPRVEAYAACATNPELALSWIAPPALTGPIAFRCDYAANSVQELADWNRQAPALRDLRTIAQSCSLKMALVKGPAQT